MKECSNNSLVRLAQSGSRRAMETLWGRFCEMILGLACAHSRRLRSDFALEDCNSSELARAIMGNCYMTFYKATMSYDASRGVPLEAFYAQKVGWQVKSEKRVNSVRSSREQISDDSFFAIYKVAEEFDNSDMVRLTNAVEAHLARKPKLSRFFKVERRVYRDYDRNEKEVAAYKLSCTRASVYNNLKAVRHELDGSPLEREFLLALAS